MKIQWHNHCLDFSAKTLIMGILNVTPDSFSDGGQHFQVQHAIDRALRMIDEGADIIDIGGESTRPGSDPVSTEEELRRTIPVIEKIASQTSVPISIDSYKADVAYQAVSAGASIINDISGLRFDPKMPETAARCGVPVIMMHIKGKPKIMQDDPQYDNLIGEIIDYFRIGIRMAKQFGIKEEMIILDPGIGFGKTFDHNLELLNNLDRFAVLGRPLLVGPSRKAFLGKILGDLPAGERLQGTAAAVTAAILKGANIIRVHDVMEMVQVAKVADAIRRERILP